LWLWSLVLPLLKVHLATHDDTRRHDDHRFLLANKSRAMLSARSGWCTWPSMPFWRNWRQRNWNGDRP